jgi:hypothetical protein
MTVKHLKFNERKQLLAMLVDSGMDPLDAVDFIISSMSDTALKKCNKETLKSHFSCLKEKHPESRTHKYYKGFSFPIRDPVSYACNTHILNGRVDVDKDSSHGCPYAFMDDGNIRNMLKTQNLEPVDIEDIVTRKAQCKNPKSACYTHYKKLAKLNMAAKYPIENLKLVYFSDFVKALFNDTPQTVTQSEAMQDSA